MGDTQAPGAPGTLAAAGAVGRATLTWGAATDNVGVVRYNLHRGTSPGFTPSAGNRIAQPTGTSYVDLIAAGTYYYRVTAEDAAGNVGVASNEAAATVTSDTTPPGATSGLGATVAGSTANLAWTAATDDVGVTRYNVHRGTSAGFTPSAANRIAQPTGTAYADTGLAIGTYYYKVTAEDAAGNVGAASNEATATVADATAPTAPTGLAATVAGSTATITWTAATDNVGVARYNLHRGTTSGFTPSAANRISQPVSSPYADGGLAPGTYFYKLTAEDAAGNVGPVSNTATATVADTTAPTAPTGLAAAGGAGQAALTWTAATDNVGVSRYNVHRSTTSGFTPATANRIAQPTGTSYTDTGLATGTYYYKVTAEDAAGNVGAASAQATATVSAPPAVGLVAAYGFDEGAGATTADQSGTGNPGSLANLTWAGASAGKFGNALSFNGSTSVVSVADSNTLDLTNGMTLEAWVQPTTLNNWHTVIFKERPGYYSYALYANTGTKPPIRKHLQHRRPRPSRYDPARRQHLDTPRRHLRRLRARPLRERRPERDAPDDGRDRHLDRRPPHRRQHHLGRALRRPHRRSPHLQPRPQRDRDPGGHEPAGHQPRHDASERADELCANGRLRYDNRDVVDSGDRQCRRH